MKYQVEFSIKLHSLGTVIDAESLDQARELAHMLRPENIRDWRMVEDSFAVTAVTEGYVPPPADWFADLLPVCPECGQRCQLVNVGRSYWAVCHTDRIRVGLGINLLPVNPPQTYESCEEVRRRIHKYKEVLA